MKLQNLRKMLHEVRRGGEEKSPGTGKGRIVAKAVRSSAGLSSQALLG